MQCWLFLYFGLLCHRKFLFDIRSLLLTMRRVVSLRSLGSFIFSWAAMAVARRFRPAIRMGLDASSTARQVPYAVMMIIIMMFQSNRVD